MEKLYIINDPQGLHARPAEKLINFFRKFDNNIEIHYKNKVVNAKSIMYVMSLAIKCNEEIKII